MIKIGKEIDKLLIKIKSKKKITDEDVNNVIPKGYIIEFNEK
jgi:hypothetical protein